MGRSTESTDRLAALLAELEEGRRSAWVPQEDDVVDRRPLLSGLRRRRGVEPETGTLEDLGLEPDDESEEPVSRADRRARGLPGRDIRPHAPLFRSPLQDTPVEAHPARAALVGALLVVLVVAMVLGVRVWSSGRSDRPVPLAASTSTSVAGVGSSPTVSGSVPPSVTGAPVSAGTTAAAPTRVEVHVVGQVHRPGVVTLAAGSRVVDAIKAAGGALPGADLAGVNLARVLGDGEQVRVPKPGESPVAAAPASTALPGGGSSSTAAGPVNLNTADADALDTLPGVGPVLAQRIIQWRQTNGRFTSVDELGEVSGIGDKALERLRPLVTV